MPRKTVRVDEMPTAYALKSLGIDVKPMGAPLSDRLKGPWKVLTF